jgi:hypothetical protein
MVVKQGYVALFCARTPERAPRAMPCVPPRFFSLARTPRHASVRRSVRRFKNPVHDIGGLPMSGHAVHFHGLDGGTASRRRPVAAACCRRPLPMPRHVLPPPSPWCARNTQRSRSSTIKAPHRPSREGTPHHRAAIAAHRCSR